MLSYNRRSSYFRDGLPLARPWELAAIGFLVFAVFGVGWSLHGSPQQAGGAFLLALNPPVANDNRLPATSSENIILVRLSPREIATAPYSRNLSRVRALLEQRFSLKKGLAAALPDFSRFLGEIQRKLPEIQTVVFEADDSILQGSLFEVLAVLQRPPLEFDEQGNPGRPFATKVTMKVRP